MFKSLWPFQITFTISQVVSQLYQVLFQLFHTLSLHKASQFIDQQDAQHLGHVQAEVGGGGAAVPPSPHVPHWGVWNINEAFRYF